jgi:GNAT superfamily N-acetyltransferase
MSEFRVLPFRDVDAEAIYEFLKLAFKPNKAAFLHQYADWWRNHYDNYPVLVDEENRVVGYSALAPSKILLEGKAVELLWWGDMFIHPEHRGKRLQTRLNDYVRGLNILLTGFANEAGAKVYVRDGWGLASRGHWYGHLLNPMMNTKVRGLKDWRKPLVDTFLPLTRPFYRFWMSRELKSSPKVRKIALEPQVLAEVFERYNRPSNVMMSYRDVDWFQWRYLEAPYAKELEVYAIGEGDLRQVLILRPSMENGFRVWRLLDMFGDLEDVEAWESLIRHVSHEAAKAGADKVLALASYPSIEEALMRVGFPERSIVRFVWFSADTALHARMGDFPAHWGMADYDFDAPRD